jgi:hydroxymethylpyrimidine/phosphomethylpyrimidine kinase
MADVEAVHQQGGLPLAVPTALTAQGQTTFSAVPSTPRWMGLQLTALLELGPIHAVKIGMVPTRELLRQAADSLAGVDNAKRLRWVIDPVVRSSQGMPLSRLTARDYLALARPSVALTPNGEEAGWLLGLPPARDADEALKMAQALQLEGFGCVVVKGGHLEGRPVDAAAWKGGDLLLSRARRTKKKPRGTGCRFASTFATALGQGAGWQEAARAAHQNVGKFINHFRG